MPDKNNSKKEHTWRYTTDRIEPLTAILNIRVTEKQREQIKRIPGWQELLRNSIDDIITNNSDCT